MEPTPHKSSNKILILGGSGFLGNAIYRELCGYFDTYGTYCSAAHAFADNHHFLRYDMEENDVFRLLEKIRPDVIISAVRGNFAAQVQAHKHLTEYLAHHPCRLIFISAANVFDAYSKYPSYEYDKTLSHSIYGRLKIKIENMLMRLPEEKSLIVRLPMVFGKNSPRIKQLKQALQENQPIEVFPNLIMNVTHDDKFTQQIHYLINRNKSGIYHPGSTDLVHHQDFVKEVTRHLGNHHPVYKMVYTTNEERFLAVLPKYNKLPKNLRLHYQESIDHHS